MNEGPEMDDRKRADHQKQDDRGDLDDTGAGNHRHMARLKAAFELAVVRVRDVVSFSLQRLNRCVSI